MKRERIKVLDDVSIFGLVLLVTYIVMFLSVGTYSSVLISELTGITYDLVPVFLLSFSISLIVIPQVLNFVYVYVGNKVNDVKLTSDTIEKFIDNVTEFLGVTETKMGDYEILTPSEISALNKYNGLISSITNDEMEKIKERFGENYVAILTGLSIRLTHLSNYVEAIESDKYTEFNINIKASEYNFNVSYVENIFIRNDSEFNKKFEEMILNSLLENKMDLKLSVNYTLDSYKDNQSSLNLNMRKISSIIYKLFNAELRDLLYQELIRESEYQAILRSYIGVPNDTKLDDFQLAFMLYKICLVVRPILDQTGGKIERFDIELPYKENGFGNFCFMSINIEEVSNVKEQ